MGIITLALFTGTAAGIFNDLPAWLTFLHTPEFTVPKWVMIACALTMSAGTAAGGWRIIRTMGHKMVKLQPVHGFAAETTAAIIIHVGATKRLSAVKWGVVERIVWAWVLTLPVTGLLGYLFDRLLKSCGA